MAKLSGGGVTSNKLGSYVDVKREPVVNVVSPGAVSRLGAVIGPGTPHKTLYQHTVASSPYGTTRNDDCRVGGNGRVVMKAGSQASTPSPRPMGKTKPSF
jgi:hypothetical protein